MFVHFQSMSWELYRTPTSPFKCTIS